MNYERNDCDNETSNRSKIRNEMGICSFVVQTLTLETANERETERIKSDFLSNWERPRNQPAPLTVQRPTSSSASSGQKDHREKRARIVERTDNDMRSIRRPTMPWKKFLVIRTTIQIIPAQAGGKSFAAAGCGIPSIRSDQI